MSTQFPSSSHVPRFLGSTNKYSINKQPCAKCGGRCSDEADIAPILMELDAREGEPYTGMLTHMQHTFF